MRLDHLPDGLRAIADDLIVDRRGTAPRSNMTTVDIAGSISPGVVQLVAAHGLVPMVAAPTPTANQHTGDPPRTTIAGRWNSAVVVDHGDANVLGGSGVLTVDGPVEIPSTLATSEAVGFYGAQLLRFGDRVAFEATSPLPVTVMEMGDRYVDGYLRRSELGGGHYLEHHDLPHFHMPLEPAAHGHLVLGRRVDGGVEATAFRIAYGTAVYTPGGVVHADPYLVGRYLVVYSIATDYSTVVLRDHTGAPAHVTIP